MTDEDGGNSSRPEWNDFASWLSSNTLVSTNVVTLHQTRLVPGWVTVFGRVNHLGVEPGNQVYSV